MDLAVEYRLPDFPQPHGALTVNASETGVLIQSVNNLPVGTKLSLVVLFAVEFELSSLQVLAEIVWKEICWKEDWEGFQYGLKFTQVKEEDFQKLQRLLSEQFQLRKIVVLS
jgi:hypothetical protein